MSAKESDLAFDVARVAGLGKGFAPSAAAASKALGITVRQDVHPPGLEGTNYSLAEMAKFIREGRLDPRVRAWCGKVLIDAGKPKSVKAKAQAVLDAVRKQIVYEQDPISTEMMAKPHITLCIGSSKELCMPVGDCDDLVICFCSALMSIGCECRILACAYNTIQATHVLAAVLDPDNGGWLEVDPSHPTYPVGKSHPSTRRWWVDPITGNTSSSANGVPMTLGKEPDHGDFIGVGAVPVEKEPAAHALPTGVGVFPMAHAFGIGVDSASDVPVGMEGGLPCCFPEMTVKEGKDYAFSQQAVKGVGKVPSPRKI